MNKRERVLAALGGEPVDRPPLALWRHFHQEDRDPDALARATAAFAQRYDLDLVKLTPSGLYAVEDWGPEIVYPGTLSDPPYLAQPLIQSHKEWAQLNPLDPHSGALGRELAALQRTRQLLGPDVPLLMTVFSPLTLAYKLAGDHLADHVWRGSPFLHNGLAVMAGTVNHFARAALEAGADGLFFATQLASTDLCTAEDYARFGTVYDLIVLQVAQEVETIVALHLHGHNLLFDLAERYPLGPWGAISWHDRETEPSLSHARAWTSRALMAGLDRRLLRSGPPEEIAAQVRDAVEQTGGRRLILAPSCVISPETPEAHLGAARPVI